MKKLVTLVLGMIFALSTATLNAENLNPVEKDLNIEAISEADFICVWVTYTTQYLEGPDLFGNYTLVTVTVKRRVCENQ